MENEDALSQWRSAYLEVHSLIETGNYLQKFPLDPEALRELSMRRAAEGKWFEKLANKARNNN